MNEATERLESILSVSVQALLKKKSSNVKNCACDAFSATAFGAKLKQLSAMKERQSEHLVDAEMKRNTAGLIVSVKRCYNVQCSWMDGCGKWPHAENAQNLC